MFEMFRGMSQMANMLRNLPKMQEELGKMHARVDQILMEGDAGAGMVTVRVNGQMEMVSISINPEVLKDGDREMLETLIKVATNQALAKVQEAISNESRELATRMGMPVMPPGMLP